MEDFTDLFNECLVTDVLERVEAAATWARLRFAYFSILHDAGWNFSHLNEFEMDAMTVYYRRYLDRIAQSTRGFITSQRVQPTVLPKLTTHGWIN